MNLKNDNQSLSKRFATLLNLLILTLFIIFPYTLNGKESGYKYLKNYTYHDYDHQAQNWAVTQDKKTGLIYIANLGGVLVYDGNHWQLVNVPNHSVRSMAFGADGKLYVGGNNEVGYLVPDLKSSLKYVSLLEYFNHLGKSGEQFGTVWQTVATSEGVFFRTSKCVYQWDYKKVSVLVNEYCYSILEHNNILFIQQKDTGLMRMVNGKLQLLPGGELFKEDKIWVMDTYGTSKNSNKLLIGTRKGFHIYDGEHMTQFPTKVDDLLAEKRLYHGIHLYNGDFALATATGGLLVIDNNGNLKNIFNKAYGLQDEIVRFVYEDLQGNIWLALDKGLAKIENKSPFHFYDDRSGLSGSVTAIIKHKDSLYTGTTYGLFVKSKNSNRFHSVPGISNTCWDLDVHDETLLATAMNGVYQVNRNGKTTQKILNEQAYVLKISHRYPGYAFCSTRNGLVVLIFKNNLWTESHRFKEINKQITAMEESQNGDLWIISNTGDVQKIVFRDNIKLKQPEITRFDESSGLQGSEIKMAHAAGHLVFATETGLFKYDEHSNRIITDLTLGHQFAGGLERGEGGKPVFRIIEDQSKNIWFHSESRNYMAALRSNDSPQILSKPFLRIPTIQVNAIYPDPDGKSIWFGNLEGLTRYDTTVKKDCSQGFPARIREIIVNENITIANGHVMDYETLSSTTNDSTQTAPELPYSQRNLRFKCAAPFFENETETQYRYFLEGYSDKWSEWSTKNESNFTNLDSGDYTFRVEAKNIYGTTSSDAHYNFKILPPWYQTWWAYIIYGIVFLLVIFLVSKWRARQLEKEKKHLENVVEKRTQEINNKNVQLESQAETLRERATEIGEKNTQLESQAVILKERAKEIQEKNSKLEKQTQTLKEQSQKLEELDKVKSRFFANISHEFRTPLTLIMGPLEQMRSQSTDNDKIEKYNLMLKNSRRLLNLINQLLDLSRIDSGKIKLQAAKHNIVPFLKGIMGLFELLAQQNRLQLEFHSHMQEICLYFDAPKIEDAMTNLLINAIKFTTPGGKITVSLSFEMKENEKEFLKLSVQDTGIGIPKDKLPHIFDRFYQAEGSKNIAHKGTGIGLALAKELIAIHHGTIDVHSHEGKGTTFDIHLPMGDQHLSDAEKAEPAKASTPIKPSKEKLAFLMTDEEDIQDDSIPDENESQDVESINGESKDSDEENVILVVEDNADVRRLIRNSIKPYYTVIEAADGRAGVEKAKAVIPDLIISDVMMPELDGYALCKDLKTDVKTSHIPIVMLTAKASEESTIQGLDTGADDYLTKPFSTPILLSRIINLIELRRQMQLKYQRQGMLLPTEMKVSNIDDEFLVKFKSIIEENLPNEDFNIDILSDKLNMGRSTLFKKIRALTGDAPNQFILSYRLERAAQLLRQNYGSVMKVAMAVGFNSSHYFSTCFSKKFKQSPSEYKASQLEPS
jgi:signal transduction histidine kinase/DNA-binding response OmpR family regulator